MSSRAAERQGVSSPRLLPDMAGLVGQSVRRLEDDRFLRGAGQFLDDINLPGMLHAVVLRSPHAHARLLSIDLEIARAMPGVRLVLSYSDIAASGLSTVPLDLPGPGTPIAGAHPAEQPLLAYEYVRVVGDPVAFIVAETLSQARDAAEAIATEFEILPAVVELKDALSDRVLAWHGTKTNLVFDHEEGDPEATAKAFAAASHIVKLELTSNRVDALPLETRGCIGACQDDKFALYVSTQRVHILQRALADRVFKVPRERVRVIAPDTGGGFGQKNGLYGEYILCLEASRRLRRPVKWVAERSESLQSNCHGRDNLFTAEAAVDDGGRIVAIRATRLMNMGAYTAPRAMVPVLNGLTHLTGVYAVPAAHVRVQGVLTNTACTSPYRGAGRPENVFCCERLMDVIADDLNIDPIVIRRRNLVKPASQPWTSPLGTTFENADLAALLKSTLDRCDYSNLPARRKSAKKKGLLRGFGVSLFAEDLHGSQEPIPAHLKFQNGKLALMVGSGSAGHGHQTTFLQIVSDSLGLPIEKLMFFQSDTALIPDGIGTAASWSLTLGGSSVRMAAGAAIALGQEIAARLLETPLTEVVFKDGLFRVVGTNRVVGWDEIFAAQIDFSASGRFTGSGETVSIGCHVCEVDVDPATGRTDVVDFCVTQDAGRLVNPMVATGQLHGGVAQGVGQAWVEGISYDLSGQLVTGSLMDYGVLRASDLPPIGTAFLEREEKSNPLGVRGIGESAATGSSAAFANAVIDALTPFKIRHIEAPLTSARIFRSINDAQS